jgi:chromate transport protein ChrA
LSLVGTFALMSLFAVGGASAAIPEMHRIAVHVQHWMTDRQFADVYAISQLSPGPNVPAQSARAAVGRRYPGSCRLYRMKTALPALAAARFRSCRRQAGYSFFRV